MRFWFNSPKLLNRFETLSYLVKNNLSLVRYGDGEAGLMFREQKTYHQEYDALLSQKLREVLANKDKRVFVTYNNTFMQQDEYPVILKYERSAKEYTRYESIKSRNDVGIMERSKMRKVYEDYYKKIKPIYKKNILGDATVFFLGFYFDEYVNGQFYKVLELYRKLFENRRLLIVCTDNPHMGDSFPELIKAGAIQSPKSVDYVKVPSNDAFSLYESIRSEVLEYKDKVDAVMLQIGPTATVMASELTINHGLLCYDIGSFNTSIQKAWENDKFIF